MSDLLEIKLCNSVVRQGSNLLDFPDKVLIKMHEIPEVSGIGKRIWNIRFRIVLFLLLVISVG